MVRSKSDQSQNLSHKTAWRRIPPEPWSSGPSGPADGPTNDHQRGTKSSSQESLPRSDAVVALATLAWAGVGRGPSRGLRLLSAVS